MDAQENTLPERLHTAECIPSYAHRILLLGPGMAGTCEALARDDRVIDLDEFRERGARGVVNDRKIQQQIQVRPCGRVFEYLRAEIRHGSPLEHLRVGEGPNRDGRVLFEGDVCKVFRTHRGLSSRNPRVREDLPAKTARSIPQPCAAS